MIRPRRVPAGLLLALAAFSADAAPPLELASVAAGGAASANGLSTRAHVAAQGRYVVFDSRASDLVAGVSDAGGRFDVFRRDLALGSTVLVSRALTAAASGNDESLGDEVSADGAFVAFTSYATDLVAAPDTNGVSDAYLRDMTAGVTRRLSNSIVGNAAGNGDSQIAAMSADGRIVAFLSTATDLTPLADPNADDFDLFAFDRTSGAVSVVTVNRQGTGTGNAHTTSNVCISANGRYVVFGSRATDLVTETDTNGSDDVFVRDLVAGTTRLVSVAAGGGAAGNFTSDVRAGCVSDDGRYIAFRSVASNLVPTDTRTNGDVFVRDMLVGSTALISVNAAGTGSATAESSVPRISSEGRYVAFVSNSTDVVNPPTVGSQIFVRDLQALTTFLVSHTAAGAGGNGNSGSFTMTPSGGAIAFESAATDLVGGSDTNAAADAFLWRSTGIVARLSSTASGSAGNAGIRNLGIADDGLAVFESMASDLVAGDANATTDVFASRSRVFADGFE